MNTALSRTANEKPVEKEVKKKRQCSKKGLLALKECLARNIQTIIPNEIWLILPVEYACFKD